MKKATIQLETLACPACVLKIEGAVKALDGVENDSVNILFNASRAKLNFDESKLTIGEIEKAINAMGYDIIKSQVKDI